MTSAGTTTSAGGRRRGRYLLPAAILALTAAGVTAIGRGVLDRPAPQPPRTVAVAEAPTDSGPPKPGSLTTGPLMSTSPPARVIIPALDVDEAVDGLGQLPDGSMQVPGDAETVGWYTKAPTPGALGPAVLAGHVDYRKKPGTFAHLADLKPGESINVSRQDHTMAMFTVTKVGRYAKDKFPSTAVYGPINHAGLRLITCGGQFDSSRGHYEDNIVVYATLRMAHPAA
jgi:hypothetical protein